MNNLNNKVNEILSLKQSDPTFDKKLYELIIEILNIYNEILLRFIKNNKYNTLNNYLYNNPLEIETMNKIKMICCKLHDLQSDIYRVTDDLRQNFGHLYSFIVWATTHLTNNSLLTQKDYK